MDRIHWAAQALAGRLLADAWDRALLAAAIEAIFGRHARRSQLALARRLLALFPDVPPTRDALVEFLLKSRSFRHLNLMVVWAGFAAADFTPAPPFARLAIPALATPADLAAWLDLPIEQLDWLADTRRGHRRATEPALQHYRYAFVAKRDGPPRLIEAPKSRLKSIQRRILREILAPVPVHGSAYGFVAGRSCVGGAQIHAGEALVACFDLQHFFPTLRLGRVHGIFRSLGYPLAVARLLTGLCTTVTPDAVFRTLPEAQRHDPAVQQLHAQRHLPQGAPTSPALANLAAWSLDRRLHGLGRAAGANYSRYADDLAFSGDAGFASRIAAFGRSVAAIVEEEGFALNRAKTRMMRQGARQQVTGIVVNQHCNLGRTEFDTLKATLHNCARHGPDGQNRDGVADFRRHLDGRIAWVEQLNPWRGAKLRGVFDAIAWPDPGSGRPDLGEEAGNRRL